MSGSRVRIYYELPRWHREPPFEVWGNLDWTVSLKRVYASCTTIEAAESALRMLESGEERFWAEHSEAEEEGDSDG